MTKTWTITIAVCAAVAVPVAMLRLSSARSQTQAEPSGSALLVLGDSLSDSGNAAAFVDAVLGQPMYPEPTVGLCHPVERWLLERDCTDLLHGRSRVSDGPVAVEHLAAHLGIAPFDPSFHTVPERPVVGMNYAVAGAKARREGVGDLTHQLDRLVLDHGPVLPPGTAVVLMIGGNDAIDALQAAALPQLEDPTDALAEPRGLQDAPTDGRASSADIVAGAVDGIASAASRLLDVGASCVVVANVPSLAPLPAVRDEARRYGVDDAAATAAAQAVSAELNSALHTRLLELAAVHPAGSALVPFDLHTHFDAARAAAAEGGANVEDACFDSERYAASTAGRRSFHPDCTPAAGDPPSFEQFFFWDGIHPTGRAHAALGAALVDTYDAGCPVP